MSTTQFTTIATADLLDSLCDAVDAARVTAAGSQRWLNAIDAAFEHILQTDTIEYRASDHALRYHSESGQTYEANGRCQCKAFEKGDPCKHRAASKLVCNALDLAAANAAADAAIARELTREYFSTALDADFVDAVLITSRPACDPSTGLPYEMTQVEAMFVSRFVAGKSAQEEIDELYA